MKKTTRFPPQAVQTFLWKAKDNCKHTDYKWEAVYITEGKRASKQVIQNKPGPSNKAIKVKTTEDLFADIISNDMTNNIASLTNAKIQFLTHQHPSWNGSEKYSYVKPTT